MCCWVRISYFVYFHLSWFCTRNGKGQHSLHHDFWRSHLADGCINQKYSKIHSLSSNHTHTACTCPRSIECGSLFIRIFFTIVLNIKSPKVGFSDGSFSCEKSFSARTQSDPKNFNGAGMTPLLKWSWSRHSVGPQRSARDRDVENHGTMVASWWCTFWYSWMPGCCCFQCSRWKNAKFFGQKLPESKVQHTS